MEIYEVICIVPNKKDWEKTIEIHNLREPIKVIAYNDPRDDENIIVRILRKFPAIYQSMRLKRVDKIVGNLEQNGLDLSNTTLFFTAFPHGAYFGSLPDTFKRVHKSVAMLLDMSTLRVNLFRRLLSSRMVRHVRLYRLLRNATLLILEEDILSEIKKKVPKAQFMILPEPVTSIAVSDGWEEKLSSQDAVLHRKLAALDKHNKKVCLLIGMLSKRKGVYDLIKLWEQTKKRDQWAICLVGKIQWQDFNKTEKNYIKSFFEREQSHIFHPHRVDSEILYQYCYQCSNLVYAAYKNFTGSSSTLSYAAFSKTPTLVANKGVMAQRVNKYCLGYCLPNNHAKDLEMLYEKASRDFSKWDAYVDKNSLKAFQSVVCEAAG